MCETWTLVLGGALVGSGGVLTVGSLWKLRQPAMFRAVLRSQGIRRPWLTSSIAWTVPPVELVVGLGAIVGGVLFRGQSLRWTALALAIVGTGLLVYVLVNLARGQEAVCGCLNADDSFGVTAASRSGFLAAAGWTAAIVATDAQTAESLTCAGTRLMLGVLTTSALVLGLRPFTRLRSSSPID
jgi:hypothetical protein